MSYKDRGFWDRWNSPSWAEAERVFAQVWPDKFEKRGNDRTELSIRLWSPFLRYMPDFLDRYGWIECKGFGVDRVVKFKDETRTALRVYAKHDQVRVFLWDRTLQRWAVVDWPSLDRKLRQPHEVGVFDGRKPWRGLHVDQINKLAPIWHAHVPQDGPSPD